MNYYNGYKVVVVDQVVQKIQLSNSVQLTSEFRQEFNEWLAIEFGYKKLQTDEDDVIIIEDTMYVTPGQHEILKQEIKNRENEINYTTQYGYLV